MYEYPNHRSSSEQNFVMTTNPQPTIFALSSAPGRAGVAVIRISGHGAGSAIDLMAGPRPSPRVAGGRAIRHPKTSEVIDRGVVLWFPAPKSFTGEDVVELQIHGGRAVTAAVLDGLSIIPNFRFAEPGEFARRAFENGKLDLAEVEGLADLVEAETEAQRRQALAQASGALSALYEGWRRELIEAIAYAEAAIDFSDEGDVGTRTYADARRRVTALAANVHRHLDDGHRGEILREGFRVALIGAPNVGKSSLLNALARRDAAIVSEDAGTTRDVIEVRLDLKGLPVILADTAGVRAAANRVEQEGIRRSFAAARDADLVLWLTDAREPEPLLPEEIAGLADRTLHVANKIDLMTAGIASVTAPGAVAISATTGAGLAELTEKIAAIAGEKIAPREEPAIAHVRHRKLLETCAESLDAFLSGGDSDLELRAEDLRRAANALGRITGRVDVEDILDRLFARFCVGK
jgi:tRNA modification GTPase